MVSLEHLLQSMQELLMEEERLNYDNGCNLIDCDYK